MIITEMLQREQDFMHNRRHWKESIVLIAEEKFIPVTQKAATLFCGLYASLCFGIT